VESGPRSPPGSAQLHVEVAHSGGAWRRLSSPAPASGRSASHKDPTAFSIFVLDPIAYYFLFRDLIVFLFSVLVHDCFSILSKDLSINFLILKSDKQPNNISPQLI
jgi:hypothetical protein